MTIQWAKRDARCTANSTHGRQNLPPHILFSPTLTGDLLICLWTWGILGDVNNTSCVYDAIAKNNETRNLESATCFVCLELPIPVEGDPSNSAIPPFTCMPPAPQNSCNASDVAVLEGCEDVDPEVSGVYLVEQKRSLPETNSPQSTNKFAGWFSSHV